MNNTAATEPHTEIATFTAADDDTCGVRITWDGMAYVAEGIETGHQVARTASTPAIVAHVAAYLISYDADADGDWRNTAAQGYAMLDDLFEYAELVDDALLRTGGAR